VRKEERAEARAQKKKEDTQKKAEKAPPIKVKTPVKPRKALIKKKKVVRFISGDIEKGVVTTPAKQSSRGHIIKSRVIFEIGSN
jgi:hypothetical protein